MTSSPPNLLSALLASCTHGLAEPGAMLFEEGQPSKGLHLVASAKVRLIKASPTGNFEIQPDLGAGMVLGIPEILAKKPHCVSALVVERGNIGFIGAEALYSLLGTKMDALSTAIRANVQARVQLTSLLTRIISSVFEVDEAKLSDSMASD